VDKATSQIRLQWYSERKMILPIVLTKQMDERNKPSKNTPHIARGKRRLGMHHSI
jgi:hypothetical protein